VEGVVEMIIDATQGYEKPLTNERLFGWYASVFPTGRSGLYKIKVGQWRDGLIDVTSGPIGHERVHFEGPPADRIEKEMSLFLDWFNNEDATDLVLRACIAHLWFVTVHPFEDGNGRIARALADMLLARSEKSAQRFYSMSAQIRNEREAYYGGLEETQKGTLDITARMEWFLQCLDGALDGASATLAHVLRKARFWETYAQTPFNDRQRSILNRLLDRFEGKLTSSKWASLAKCSQDTASRDIMDLVQRGVLTKDPAGGRSTSYSLTFQDASDTQKK
jgi:Fic family protein